LTRRIEKLQPHHAVDTFDCGQESLNRFLKKHALENHRSGGSQTYVGLADEAVIGYYTLAVGSAEQEQAPERVKKGLAKHAVPLMLLARLAVDLHWQNQGVGAALLKNAILRTLQAADIAGIRALVVHAKDDAARKFYECFDFFPSPTDPLHLFALLKDLRKIASQPSSLR
jgi:GNAT superfamily N-acetyltransferase